LSFTWVATSVSGDSGPPKSWPFQMPPPCANVAAPFAAVAVVTLSLMDPLLIVGGFWPSNRNSSL
jgi:hypothetical protein